MRWMVVVCVAVIGLGCSRAHQELVDITQESLRVDAYALVPDPAIEQLLLKERHTEHVDAAKRMLKEGDLATAAVLLEQALQLDPSSKAAIHLQKRLEAAQRRAEEQARRTLVDLYQREGREILSSGDFDRALAYFRAAQELDPANRKLFQLIQRAYETQSELLTKQREQEFKERVRLAKAEAQAATPTEVAATEGEDLVALAAALAETPVEPVMTEVAAQPEAPAVQEELAVPEAPAIQEQAPATVTGYGIQPEDILEITVYEEPDLTTKSRVTSSGEITVPLLGRVAVMGLTVAEVQEKLTTLWAADYLVNPQVQVFIETYHARNVFVTGSVNKPGSYAIPTEQPTTLLEAIAMAGGFSNEAAPNGTRIIRIEEGQEKMITVKVDNIIKKGDKTQDVVVRPSDIIFVPESFF